MMPIKMAYQRKFYEVFIVLILFVTSANCDVLCEHGFCSDFLHEEGCFAALPHCGINNATHSGLFVPSPTICNCCEYCLPYIHEGQPCSLGGPGNGLMVGRCGYGLTCVKEENGNHCRRMESKCHSDQDDYDDRHKEGNVGSLEVRPLCDEKGNYAPAVCVPTQSCFCQSEDGERIFGEVLNRGMITISNLHCGCSRVNHKIQNLISSALRMPAIGPRCTPDGNFNPLQCVGRICHCVDRIIGVVNLNAKIDLDDQPVSELPCYDPHLDIFAKFYPPQEQAPYNYTTPCYEAMETKMKLILTSEKLGFDVDHFSTVDKCLPDGSFERIATTVNGSKICVDPVGHQIQNFGAEPNTPGFEEIDCKCALTSLLMTDMPEQPICCSNGNFRPIQCRRGVCRCVDSDGRQFGPDSADVTNLPCHNETISDWRTC